MLSLGDGLKGSHVATGTGRSAIRAPSRRDHPAKGHVAAWVAWGICGFYWVAVGVGFMLRALSDPRFSAGDELSWRVGFGAYPTVGALILARQPRNRIGWLCCAVGLLVGPAPSPKRLPGTRWSTGQARCPAGWRWAGLVPGRGIRRSD
jgi:hypothetical protein